MTLWEIYVDGAFSHLVGADVQDDEEKIIAAVKKSPMGLLPRAKFTANRVQHISEFATPPKAPARTDVGMILQAKEMAESLIDPARFGHSVTGEVRNMARRFLGLREVLTRD